MCLVGFIKRFAPFAIAIALGLFVASFFVTVAAPSFKRGKFNKHRQYHRQQESEIRQLRIEKSRLEEDLRQERIKNQSDYTYDWRSNQQEISPILPMAHSDEIEINDSPFIREGDNFQPRIENQDIRPRKAK